MSASVDKQAHVVAGSQSISGLPSSNTTAGLALSGDASQCIFARYGIGVSSAVASASGSSTEWLVFPQQLQRSYSPALSLAGQELGQWELEGFCGSTDSTTAVGPANYVESVRYGMNGTDGTYLIGWPMDFAA